MQPVRPPWEPAFLQRYRQFEFFYFAVDDERTGQGEVLPGVGGIIYDRLGFDGQDGKNSYTPEIVKQRRQQFLDRRKVSA